MSFSPVPKSYSASTLLLMVSPPIQDCFSVFSYLSWPWQFWIILVRCFLESLWDCVMFSHDWNKVLHSWEGYLLHKQSEVLSASYPKRYMMSVNLAPRDGNLAYWVRWHLPGFSTVVPIFSFIINTYLVWRRYVETLQIPSFFL